MVLVNDEKIIKPDIELLDAQIYKNIAVIPIKTQKSYIDILTLNKGLKLGLVKVKECERSTVNTLIVKNNSTTPLILIDGEQVIGGDQNRIVNTTILIDKKSEMKIPVSCTEKGRWAYKKEFSTSDYIANSRTRVSKRGASKREMQNVVWDSIDVLEESNKLYSNTSAMEDTYQNLKNDHEEIIKEFKIEKNQNGILIIIDGEIKGFEIFLNSEIYNDFHEKILKSYIIDNEVKKSKCDVNIEEAQKLIDGVFDSDFNVKKSIGLEKSFEFENDYGLGSIATYKNHIIHESFFKKIDLKTSRKKNSRIHR